MYARSLARLEDLEEDAEFPIVVAVSIVVSLYLVGPQHHSKIMIRGSGER